MLSEVLRSVRLASAMQFCFMPTGAWQTDDGPAFTCKGDNLSTAIPFHVVVEGSLWMKMEGRHYDLREGDVIAFPFASGHQLGAGGGGSLVLPTRLLPPKPWRTLPIVRHGPIAGHSRVRLLCGYLQCDAMTFRPLRDAMPALLHLRTHESNESGWLRGAIAQIVSEVDAPRAGGISILERLSEIIFIELLRHHVGARSGDSGWLAALADPALSRCLALIHSDPRREWSVANLSAEAGLSRSSLNERFESVLAVSPMRYVRDWRLCLASVALGTSRRPIAALAEEAGYGTEAAFNRAFARAYGKPPAAWRQNARERAAV